MAQNEVEFPDYKDGNDEGVEDRKGDRFGLSGQGEFGNGENGESEVPVVQLGAGTVGGELVKKIKGWNNRENPGTRYRYVGIADSSGLIADKDGLSGEELARILKVKASGDELAEVYAGKAKNIGFLEHLLEGLDRGVLVDVTDADKLEDHYRRALDRGWSVVLANKIPLTGVEPEEFWRFKNAGLSYEATVGAGLPVISTLDHLKRHGEEFREIAAILSGSLSFILARVEAGVSLKQAVIEAKEKGFTEPNPAEDLLGNDVARKTVILGRSLGLDLSLDDITLEPLVELEEDVSQEELEEGLETAGPNFRKRAESAGADGNRLRYVARIDEREVTVGLEEVDREEPLGRGDSTANVVLFRTNNYDHPPLIVQGPGAGSEVTAGGVFSDIKCCRSTCK
ncbi:homoserine dehydrogenase [Candidatus Bipolaricaulota bacterium]|nr:homoserine dehydrogenase [Candidatus Bipolaricaulota bacterium]